MAVDIPREASAQAWEQRGADARYDDDDDDDEAAQARAAWEELGADLRARLRLAIWARDGIADLVAALGTAHPLRPKALASLHSAEARLRRVRAEVAKNEALDRTARRRAAKRAKIRAKVAAAGAQSSPVSGLRALAETEREWNALHRQWAREDRRRRTGVCQQRLFAARRAQPRARTNRRGTRRLARAPAAASDGPDPDPDRSSSAVAVAAGGTP